MPDIEGLRGFTTKELLQELGARKDQLVTPDGGVVPGLYGLWAEFKPITSLDMILVRTYQGRDQIGVIMRATGPEKGYLALIGGGINKNEPKMETMARHLKADLGIKKFYFVPPQTLEDPFYAAEYPHMEYPGNDRLFDPGKHSVATTYLLQTNDVIRPKNEASGIMWLYQDEIPVRTAYNQGIIMRAAFDYLKNIPRPQSN